MTAKSSQIAIRQCVLDYLKKKSINEIKVTEVVDSLGISRGTFYLYYDSVYSVLQEIEDEFFEGLLEQVQGAEQFPFSHRFFNEPHPYVVKVANYLKENKDFILTMYGPYGDQLFQIKINKLINTYFIEKAIDEGYLVDDFNEPYVKGFLIGGHVQMILDWLKQSDQIPPEKMAVQCFRMMFGFYLNNN